MLLKVHSASVLGIQAQMIDIEVDLSIRSDKKYHVVGLPDAAIKESGERVRAAIHNCGYDFPSTGCIVVNLAPADFKKEGSCYDLPIALAILGLTGAIRPDQLQDWLILGELSSGRPCSPNPRRSSSGSECGEEQIPAAVASR